MRTEIVSFSGCSLYLRKRLERAFIAGAEAQRTTVAARAGGSSLTCEDDF
jgi:hypothetical protein